jgi:hypothetical protein
MLKALKVLEMRYYGTIYGSYFLGCSCIGKAKIEGVEGEVFITWGRELKGREIKEFTTGNSMTWPQLVYYPTTKNEKSIKKYEMLIPFSVMELIKPAISVMTRTEEEEKTYISIHHPAPKSKPRKVK